MVIFNIRDFKMYMFVLVSYLFVFVVSKSLCNHHTFSFPNVCFKIQSDVDITSQTLAEYCFMCN